MKKVLERSNLTIIVFVTAFLVIGCNNKFVFYSDDFQDEIYQVVDISVFETNASDYDNKPIEIVGYFHMDMENLYLYINNNKNRIWLDYNFFKPLKDNNNETLDGKKLMTLKGKKVKVRGIFRMNNTGHLGVYNGGVTEITWVGSK